jgi:hypothetical protein
LIPINDAQQHGCIMFLSSESDALRLFEIPMKPLFSLGDTALKGARPRPVLDDALAHSDLPAPGRCGGRPIMKASSLRRTTRDLASTELPDVSLGDLLWAANGVNREDNDGRAAPSFQRISARYCNVPNAASMLE